MTALLEMYNLLEEMLDYARQDNSAKVSKLNTSFEKLFHNISPDYMRTIGSSYDNCRQSCLMAETMPSMRQEFLEDARERFSQLAKPLN